MIRPHTPYSLAQAAGLRLLEPRELRLWFAGDALQLEIRDEICYPRITVLRVFPLSHPHTHVSLRSAANKEIGLLVDPSQLAGESRAALAVAIERRYFTTRITRIHGITERFGTLEWRVETERGMVEFTIKDLREHLVQPTPERMLVTDVEGNRFEIPDLTRLDRRSTHLLRMQV